MISMEEFEILADQVANEIPSVFYNGLNGGIRLKEEERLHPLSREKAPVYILGLYIKDEFLGCRIELYYGSFAKVCRNFVKERMIKEIRDVLRHEFQHHVEIMCGNIDLILEDEKELKKIEKRRRRNM
ncbi:metallopeptidase family protein [Anaerotignum sp. MB30-C6]|uniref:metallopeptidase family protein n=1 Tax=Anaerotignum sp. MB30-C6 TaxID=3070814 RepID=UPI0027DD4065|nr:metallopeptidase family protein [Anaerotignum sp. MB30-C6]WMI80191.1 metallopeptidase family protein [Anaerotignum sp. MB30-C6]